ncbi:MAG TPA: hypothetical protein VET45_12065 [Candidatus Binatia bacterium]|nr:hypothetical protein [Candidatus Binatia bacterium]
MAQSLTESLRKNRLIVVAVDQASGRVRVKEESEACTDLSCSKETLVVSDQGISADLQTLNPGDIVKLEGKTGSPQRIVVVRRVWDELTSPEW